MFTFTANSITCEGQTFPVEYSVTPSGSVFVFVQQEGKTETLKIRFRSDHPQYAAALAAAKGEQPTEERPAIIPEETTAQPDGKQARGPVPEKTFIGQTIAGNGWRILFDASCSRTRILFDSAPTDAARAALANAGFYFSSPMGSWNKKLTFRAYRAAQALAAELETLYPCSASA